ncbi:MAG TPA: HAMP domain-containing sensor histidine kinase [Candidatus Paceibacterota bacterium]|nr:HAMP domain-containing sensor histidine kinase [Candidatus Paceibacterota bacterium]
MRLFAGSVTGFAHRYRRDVFYRTGWNVVLLQVVFTLILTFLALASLNFLYQGTVQGLITAIVESVASGSSPTLDSISIAANLEYEKQKNMVLTATTILMAAAIFGWLVTKIALVPTKNALESQKQFVGNIAHELRTPLSIIKTNTEVILFDKSLNKETVDTLKSNNEELDRISDIINNLLSLNTLLQPGKIAFSNVDLGSVIERIERNLQELAAHKEITFSVKSSEHRVVWGNPSGIEQILMNIVKNAFNYTPNGGHVSITIEPTYRGQVEIRVQDDGMGIPEKDLDRIFEPFYRGDASRNRMSGGGSGLGLAIVSELVKLHKGSVAIQSAQHRGTTVTITLPAGRDLEAFNKPKHEGVHEVTMDFT